MMGCWSEPVKRGTNQALLQTTEDLDHLHKQYSNTDQITSNLRTEFRTMHAVHTSFKFVRSNFYWSFRVIDTNRNH